MESGLKFNVIMENNFINSRKFITAGALTTTAIVMSTWSPIARGFLTDRFNEYSGFAPESRFPGVGYFSPEALKKNLILLKLVRDWYIKKDMTPVQFSLAWLMAQKPFIVPIRGTIR
jgi:aryl-alcohol dehydrogenase-like predicted oxidoreductase